MRETDRRCLQHVVDSNLIATVGDSTQRHVEEVDLPVDQVGRAAVVRDERGDDAKAAARLDELRLRRHELADHEEHERQREEEEQRDQREVRAEGGDAEEICAVSL